MHDGEQILTGQRPPHFRGIRVGHGGIVGGDEQRFYRRIIEGQQRLGEFEVVDGAGCFGAGGFADGVVVQVERRRRGQ